jgi:ATP-dependent DNA helicase RecG
MKFQQKGKHKSMLSTEEVRKIINKEENLEIEFKESLSGLKSEDIVAFANSKGGGIILVGVTRFALN